MKKPNFFEDIFFNNKWTRWTIIGVLAFLNACSLGYLAANGDTSFYYYGTDLYGCNPMSLAFFALDCILLGRFIDKNVLRDKGRIILSVILGYLFGLSCIFGVHILYGESRLFDTAGKIALTFIVPLGIMLISTPIFSELTGFFNRLSSKSLQVAQKQSVSVPKQILYFFIMWAVFFLSYLPIFLYFWPGNYVADAAYQTYNFMTDSISTHHPVLHTLMLGKAYEIGYNRGNVSYGIQFFTLAQMLVLSSSFAFLATHIYKNEKRRSARILLVLLVIVNPVINIYSISTIKGVWSSAFAIFAITFLMKIMEKETLKAKIPGFIGFFISLVLSSLFRNNMIYAVLAGGIIIACFQKGVKQKLVFLLVIILTVGCYKVTNNAINNSVGAGDPDSLRESNSVPLMCLARVIVNHADELDPVLYNEIRMFMPDPRDVGYSINISDAIKNPANEAMLRVNKFPFYRLVGKLAFMYPGDYIEAVAGLTMGYWYSLDMPYFLVGISKLSTMSSYGGYPGVVREDLLPIGSQLFDYLNADYNRFNVPIFGWFFRAPLYVWGYLFAMAYLIYRRDTKRLSIVMIPFMYLLTCFLGPVSWLRYIIINVTNFHLVIYLLATSEKLIKNK